MDSTAKEIRRSYNREYMREWRQKDENKEKIRKYNRTYWEKKAIEQREKAQIG